MLKISYYGDCAVFSDFDAIHSCMCAAAENHKNITEPPYFGGSKLFKVIDVDTNDTYEKLVGNAC